MTRYILFSLLPCVLMIGTLRADEPRPLTFAGDDGLVRVNPPEVPEAWRNADWPEAWETDWWRRVNHAMRHFQNQRSVNTHGEMEKADYPALMFAYMAGNRDVAMQALETEDLQAGTDHAWTLGIDYYWCFTLKGQMRKYFQFGPFMTPAYRQRMFDAAKIWTAEDPRPTFELVLSLRSPDPTARRVALEVLQKLRANIHALDDVEDATEGQDLGDDPDAWTRWWAQYSDRGWQVFEDIERRANPLPHPRHGVGTGPVGGAWDPNIRGMRVDARNTDNLRAMREISVYLMAEETGNEEVRALYKDKIRRFVTDLYHVGMGEWDSENYLHHTIAPYHNLYDFAQDEEVVALAKAALDAMYTSAALKYWRGSTAAPTKRTGGGLAQFMWMIFGDSPVDEPRPYYDLAHPALSAYRVPRAVKALARRQFDLPAEQINTKPTYSVWLPNLSETPETWETLYYGHSFYLGSAVARSGAGDVRAFEVMTYSSARGADNIQANSGNRLSGKRGGDQIGQIRNLAVWLSRGNDPFIFQLPGDARTSQEDGIWFVELERTWLAIRPINLRADGIGEFRPGSGDRNFRVPATGGPYTGFALEIGERETHRDFANFRRQVRARGGLDLSNLARGRAVLTGSDGRVVDLTHNPENDLPILLRDGERYDWLAHMDLHRPMIGDGPVAQGWREGTLRVRAGGHTFTQTVTPDGQVSFTEE